MCLCVCVCNKIFNICNYIFLAVKSHPNKSLNYWVLNKKRMHKKEIPTYANFSCLSLFRLWTTFNCLRWKKNTSVNVGFYRMAFGFEMLARRWHVTRKSLKKLYVINRPEEKLICSNFTSIIESHVKYPVCACLQKLSCPSLPSPDTVPVKYKWGQKNSLDANHIITVA